MTPDVVWCRCVECRESTNPGTDEDRCGRKWRSTSRAYRNHLKSFNRSKDPTEAAARLSRSGPDDPSDRKKREDPTKANAAAQRSQSGPENLPRHQPPRHPEGTSSRSHLNFPARAGNVLSERPAEGTGSHFIPSWNGKITDSSTPRFSISYTA